MTANLTDNNESHHDCDNEKDQTDPHRGNKEQQEREQVENGHRTPSLKIAYPLHVSENSHNHARPGFLQPTSEIPDTPPAATYLAGYRGTASGFLVTSAWVPLDSPHLNEPVLDQCVRRETHCGRDAGNKSVSQVRHDRACKVTNIGRPLSARMG